MDPMTLATRFASCFLAGCQKVGVDGDEGGRQGSFAEQVLKQVRNFQGGLEGVGCVRIPEVVGEEALPHQPDDAAEKNARSDENRIPA